MAIGKSAGSAWIFKMPGAEDRGNFLTELKNERWKAIIAALVSALSGAALMLYAVHYHKSSEDFFKTFFVVGFLIFFSPHVFSFSHYIYRQFYIKAYKNGLEIRHLGFFTWDRVGINSLNNVLLITLTGKELPEHPKSILNGDITFTSSTDTIDQDSPNLLIWISMKKLFSTSSGEDFFEKFKAYVPVQNRLKIQDAPVETITRKQGNFWRSFVGENPTPFKIGKALLFYISAGFMLYYVFAVASFTMDQKALKFTLIASCLLGWVLLYKLARTASTNPVLQKYSPLARIFLYAFAFIFYPYVIYIGIFAGPIAAYTRYFGQTYEAPLAYNKDAGFRKAKCGYEIEHTGEFAKNLCLSDENYNKMVHDGTMRIYGHVSPLGKTIEQYSVPMLIPSDGTHRKVEDL